MSQKVDRTGQRYGRLLVLREGTGKDYGGRHIVSWICQCDCGNICDICTSSLQSNLTKSCGCLNHEKLKMSSTKHFKHHGGNTSLYHTWQSMKRRCYQESEPSFQKYGGRGISVCDEWRNDFVAFKEWAMSHGYDDTKSIDRIDVNGNYEPSNCRWATHKEQQNNKTNNHIIEWNGVRHTLSEWHDITNISRYALAYRHNHGWSPDEIFLTPLRVTRKPNTTGKSWSLDFLQA